MRQTAQDTATVSRQLIAALKPSLEGECLVTLAIQLSGYQPWLIFIIAAAKTRAWVLIRTKDSGIVAHSINDLINMLK